MMEEDNKEIVEDEYYIPDYLRDNPYLKKRIRNYQFFNRGI